MWFYNFIMEMAVVSTVITACSFIDIASRMLYSKLLHHTLGKEITFFLYMFPRSQSGNYFHIMGIIRCQTYYFLQNTEKENKMKRNKYIDIPKL